MNRVPTLRLPGALDVLNDAQLARQTWALAETEGVIARMAFAFSRRSGMEREDFLQAGRLGTLRALAVYDPERGAFTTYARWWIFAEMQRCHREQLPSITLPECAVAGIRRVRKIERRAAHRGQTLTEAALAARLGISEERLAELRQAQSLHTLSYNTPHEDEGSLAERLADAEQLDEAELTAHVDTHANLQRLRGAMRELAAGDPRTASLVTLRFGLGGAAPVTTADIAEEVGLCRSRVAQLIDQGLDVLAQFVAWD